MIRKWLCLLLVCMLVFPVVSGLADNPDGETLEYMYSFIPGTVLEGEGTKMIRELLDEVKIRFTRQKTETNDIIRIQLISNGTDAFSLTAGQMGGEEFALMCSLLGSNKLTLKQEQIAPFLHTLVESLGEQGFLKGDNLNKMYSIADRAGVTINNYLAQEPEEAPVAGIDITPYLKTLTENATAVEQREIPPEEQDGSGAVIMTSYLLSEEQRREFVNMGIDKFSKVPVIGDALNDGSLRIGEQVITEDFLRTVFGDTLGEVTMDVWQDGSGQLVRMLLHLPDLHGVVLDPEFAKTEGIELTIARTYGEGKRLTSVTTLRLLGLEGNLVTMTLERSPTDPIPPMKAKKVHEVGEMTSTELSELIRSMGWTILGNAGNMVLDLPDCIARVLVKKIFK